MKIKSRYISLLITLCLSALMPSTVFGVGLAAIKENKNDDDAAAKIIVYSSLKTEGNALKITSGDKEYMMDKNKLAAKVEVISTLPANTPSPDELKQIQNTVVEYRRFTERFPKSSTSLNPHITALDTFITKAKGDKVRFNGKWVSEEEALVMKQKDENVKQAAEMEATREIREKIAFHEEQKAKGLAKYNDKWIPINEAKLLAQKDQVLLNQAQNKASTSGSANTAAEADSTPNRIKGGVVSIAPEGLIVDAKDYTNIVSSSSASVGGGGGVYAPPDPNGKGRPKRVEGLFLITGHPKEDSMVDKDRIDVDAIEDGVYSYTSVDGGERRISKYRVIKTY